MYNVKSKPKAKTILDYPKLLLSCMSYIRGNDKHNKQSIELCIQYFPEHFNRLNVADVTGIPYAEVCRLTNKYDIKYKKRVYCPEHNHDEYVH